MKFFLAIGLPILVFVLETNCEEASNKLTLTEHDEFDDLEESREKRSAFAYNSIGCFKDTGRRAIPQADGRFPTLKGNYQRRSNAIQKCAKVASDKGYKVFSVQNGGWCATGPNAHTTYKKYGPSNACKGDGKGGPWANQVYGVNGWRPGGQISFETSSSFKYASIGCFKDTGRRAIPQADGRFPTLKGNYQRRSNAIQKCAKVASDKGYKVFSVQNGGWCATGPNAHTTYKKYGPSNACKGDGKGGPWANQVYGVNGWRPGGQISFETSSSFKYASIGCFKDTGRRAIPQADGRFPTLKGNYQRRSNAIQKCAKVASDKGYKVFSVQNGGWCATGPNAHTTYKKYGPSNACKGDGKGGPWANQVYGVNGWRPGGQISFETGSSFKYASIGCFKDTGRRAIPQADGRFPTLKGNYQRRSNAIQKCAKVASDKGYKVFSVQNGGWCATGPNAHTTYKKYGPSNACKGDGKGGPWANQVYGVNGWRPGGQISLETSSSFKYASIGCFKDTGRRAIPQADGRFPTLKGNYQRRSNAIQKCAKVASDKGYKVFSVQNGGWCATGPNAHETYKKYGPSNACKGDGKGGPWANQVYGVNGWRPGGQISFGTSSRNKYASIGCFKDTGNRAIPQADGRFPTLKGNYQRRSNAIQKCAKVASDKGYKVFSVQNGGWCATGPNAHKTYKKYGTSKACKGDGKGGPWANQVYGVNGWRPGGMISIGGEGGEFDGLMHISSGNTVGEPTGGEISINGEGEEFDGLMHISSGNTVGETTVLKYETIGCYKDTGNRAIPQADGRFPTLKGNYQRRKNAIEKCSQVALDKGYKVFAVQNGGWCATGPNAHKTYNKYGSSNACKGDGKGGPWANAVYGVTGWRQESKPEFEIESEIAVRYTSIGCFRDTGNRAIPQADGRFPTLKGNYQRRDNAIGKCAKVAADKGYKVFSVQNGGWCATGPDAHLTYQKYGPSSACKGDGKGGPWANAVYGVNGWKPKPLEKLSFIDLGCWRDKGNRAITGVDTILTKRYGPYTARKEAIQKCGNYAKSKGYSVFAVQNGGWCATSINAEDTFDKYGPYSTCRKDGEGGPWGNQVYKIVEENYRVKMHFRYIGCYKDTGNRAIPQADGRFQTLRDSYQQRNNAVKKCAMVAASLGYKAFAVQNGGWCATGKDAHLTYGKYGLSSNCKEGGKGGAWANAVYAVNGWMPISLIDLGCWKDTGNRAIPSADHILAKKFGPYQSRVGSIQKCAQYAKSKGYSVFAVQNGGWCATSKNAEDTFDKYGPYSTCRPDGEGGPWGSQVYRIKGKSTKIGIRYTSIGCFRDTGNRAIPQADGRFQSLRDSYPQRKDAIAKCARVATDLGYKVFAVQNGGWCATGSEAHMTYQKYGPSNGCRNDGEGGPWANHVYGVNGWKPEPLSELSLLDLGCWRDNGKRAIPGVDTILTKRYGPYTARKEAIQTCGNFAKSKGYSIFAVQNGGWCATSKNAGSTFDKYGPYSTCRKDGEGGPWGNQVYKIVGNNFKIRTRFNYIGCYKDTGNRAISQADGRFQTLRDNYKQRRNAIRKCAMVASSLGYKVFAVQNGGWCATGKHAHLTYGKYGLSSNCKEGGKGGVWANAVYAVNGWKPIQLIDLGCWKDTANRAISSVDKILAKKFGAYQSRIGSIQRCAQYAKSKGYSVFAVQNGGWCATSKNAEDTFDKYGPYSTCRKDGEGGPWGNQVYKIGNPTKQVSYASIGCFRDTGNRAIPQADGRFQTLRDSYTQRKDAIAKCARVATDLGYKVFAVQNGGWCATGSEAHMTYQKYGPSNGCRKDGEGGPWANQVYGVNGWKPEPLSELSLLDLGCWRDNGKRAIPGVDTILTKRYGPYTARKEAIQKCGNFAKSKGYSVFAVQNGGWCATSKNAGGTFDKYGPYSTCRKDGEGGPWGNQVYKIVGNNFKIRTRFNYIGCYKDTGNRAIPQADGRFQTLRDNYKQRRNAIRKCAMVASSLGYEVFAVQNGGWCATGKDAHLTYGKYGLSSNCKEGGKGGVWANAVYAVNGWMPISLIDLGCWKDTGNRAIPSADHILAKKFGPYQSRVGSIQKCAQYAKSKEYSVFAVQNGGWCATSKNAEDTFDKYGPYSTCRPDGEGGPWGNQVYRIAGKSTKIGIRYTSIGCFRDTGNRAIPQADGRFQSLRDSYPQRKDAIAKCARVATDLGYKVFAVQNGGWCATGTEAHMTYQKYGPSNGCRKDGEGGPWANHVYGVNGWKPEPLSELSLLDLGCWRDNGKRAIPGVDTILTKRYGPYTARKEAIQKCGNFAKSKGYSVFAVQNGGWCATSKNAGGTFDKYGPYSTCRKDGEGGPWGNQVYKIVGNNFKIRTRFNYIGCYKDTGNRAIPQADGRFQTLRDNYKQRRNAIRKCAMVASSLGYKLFAVQNGGWCATGRMLI
uniref:uncharacterized protein LOC120327143 isoform X1 n=1 Tax=Styela clava TaxID=7725 RepID=UPI00193A30F8|nr:uncharacterized protein LOC120327143 isoform X1 [Styela clava]